MKRRLLPLLILPLLLGFIASGCIPSHFSVVDGGHEFKSKRIAVIGGVDDQLNAAIAHRLTQELAAKTTFKVMPTQEIVNRIEGYPQKIRGPYSSAHIGIDQDYENTDINRIKQVQSRLGVEYLYVMWAPSVVEVIGGGSKVIQVHIITQLFAFPGAKEIAHAKYFTGYQVQGLGTGPRTLEGALEDTSRRAAEAIIEKTGMGKPVPKK